MEKTLLLKGHQENVAKSVDVKFGEIESGLKIEKDSKTGKKTTSANVKYGEDFSIAWIIRKRCKIC